MSTSLGPKTVETEIFVKYFNPLDYIDKGESISMFDGLLAPNALSSQSSATKKSNEK